MRLFTLHAVCHTVYARAGLHTRLHTPHAHTHTDFTHTFLRVYATHVARCHRPRLHLHHRCYRCLPHALPHCRTTVLCPAHHTTAAFVLRLTTATATRVCVRRATHATGLFVRLRTVLVCGHCCCSIAYVLTYHYFSCLTCAVQFTHSAASTFAVLDVTVRLRSAWQQRFCWFRSFAARHPA